MLDAKVVSDRSTFPASLRRESASASLVIREMELLSLISFSNALLSFAKAKCSCVRNGGRHFPDSEDDMEQCPLDPGLGKFLCFEKRSGLKKTMKFI